MCDTVGGLVGWTARREGANQTKPFAQPNESRHCLKYNVAAARYFRLHLHLHCMHGWMDGWVCGLIFYRNRQGCSCYDQALRRLYRIIGVMNASERLIHFDVGRLWRMAGQRAGERPTRHGPYCRHLCCAWLCHVCEHQEFSVLVTPF